MKTAFLHAYAWRNLFKSYYYHGILMQCKTPPAPGYWIGYNTTPPINPPNFTYPCDGLPATATPPMTYWGFRNAEIAASGGLLHYHYKYTGDSGSSFYSYYWQFATPIKIEFEVSFPLFRSAGAGAQWMWAIISLPGTNGITFNTWQQQTKIGGIWVITNSYFTIMLAGVQLYRGAFLSTWRGKLIKNISTGKWDIYLNDALITTEQTLAPLSLAWYMCSSAYADCYIDMDYLNAWLNIDRIP